MLWPVWSTLLLLLNASAANGSAQSAIDEVFPSGPELAVNTLRLSIRFKAVQIKAVLPDLALRDETGRVRNNVFLQQELWSPDRKVLTVLFDPGRLKTGIERHDFSGKPLAGLSRVDLTLLGVSLKQWRVNRSRCRPIDPASWQIEAPPSGSRSPMRIKFAEAVDIQAEHLLAVVDSHERRIAGSERLRESETVWVFKPVPAWRVGEYRVLLHPEFENACGDRPGDDFEHSLEARPEAAATRSFAVR